MDIFTKHGLKNTKTRQIIYEKLKEINEPINADELHKIISEEDSVNLVTIYRNLNTLAELDIIEKIIRQNGIAYYSLVEDTHTHYMVCDICNNQFKLDECPIDINQLKLIDKVGFKPTGHILEIHGVCKQCQDLKNKSK